MNGSNVLLVEDDLNDVELFRRALKHSGLHIEVALSAADAQRILKKHNNFRFAFVDLKLPDMDGTALVRWIKDRFTHIPICVLTGSDELREARRQVLADCGAIFMFTKPFTSDNLRNLSNMIDVTGANWALGKPKWSWRTTLSGVLCFGVGVYALKVGNEAVALLSLTSGIGFLCAYDNAVAKSVGKLMKKKES